MSDAVLSDVSYPKSAAPYGTWKSPISAHQIATKGVSIEDLLLDEVTGAIYQVEKRPSEGGRNTIVDVASGKDILGTQWNVRSRVHEYGGAPAVAHNGLMYFSHFGDNRVYRAAVAGGEDPVAVTPDNDKHRFANFAVYPGNPAWLIGILEDHTNETPAMVQTTLVLLDTKNQTVLTLVKGADFYSRPRFSPDGKMLAWLQWYHPDMSWDGSELVAADCSATSTGLTLDTLRHIAGERRAISVAEPCWISNTTLLFTCDKGGYLNPWSCVFGAAPGSHSVRPVIPKLIYEDFGEPAWMIGWTSYALLDDRRGVFMALRRGRAQLYLVNVAEQTYRELDTPYVVVQFLRTVGANKVVFVGKKTDDGGRIVELTVGPGAEVLYAPVIASEATKLGPRPLAAFSALHTSPAQPIELKVPPDGQSLHLVYYPPTNPEYKGGDPGEKPPVIVNVHGGPTWISDQALDLDKQFFTSRGFAWVDLNHRGSSGYGREYIAQLKGRWGVLDVDDAVECIRQLDALGLADQRRATIRGKSAGGYTTLAALATRGTAFAAGVSMYGISDLSRLQDVSHKFESHFLESLMGGTKAELPDVWRDRSPITRATAIKSPLMIMQGSMDPVVPPEQAEYIVESIRKNGGRVEYVVFDGEGHGWRSAGTVEAALEKELAFYVDVLGLGSHHHD